LCLFDVLFNQFAQLWRDVEARVIRHGVLSNALVSIAPKFTRRRGDC
jgi:hypothetical protein